MLVMDPISPERTRNRPLSPRPKLTPGARIGLLSNGKSSADLLLSVLHDAVAREYPELGEPIVLNKGTQASGPGSPASENQLAILTSGAVAVLTASGD